MTMKMKTLVLALFGCLIAASAQAQSTSVAKEITGYRNIAVKLGDAAADCNLTDTSPLQAQLSDKLAAIEERLADLEGSANDREGTS